MKDSKKSYLVVLLSLTISMVLIFSFASGIFADNSDIIGSTDISGTTPSGTLPVDPIVGPDMGYDGGDFNKDGKVDCADAVYLSKNLQNPTAYPIANAGSRDTNRDGAVNNDDVTYMLLHAYYPYDYLILDPGKY